MAAVSGSSFVAPLAGAEAPAATKISIHFWKSRLKAKSIGNIPAMDGT